MEYAQAKAIRQGGFGKLLKENLMAGGTGISGVAGSFGKTLSQRSQARAKGFKEFFDPLNLSRFVLGNLGTTMLGKTFGRSSSDIRYFTGGKKPGSTATKIGGSSAFGGSLGVSTGGAKVLEQILETLKKNHETDTRMKEIQNSTEEERQNEEQRRHDEFINVLKDFTGVKLSLPKEKEEGGGGLFDMVGNFFKSLIDKITNLFSLFRMGSPLMRFLTSPLFRMFLGPTFLMVGSILALAEIMKWAVDKVPDYTKLDAESAYNILQNGSERDIEAFGGREKLQEIVSVGRENAQRILDDVPELTDKERKNYQRLANVGMAVPGIPEVLPQATQLPTMPPRPDTTGGKNMADAKWWDNNFGKTHNPDGTPKVQTQAKPLPAGVSSTPESRADFAAGDPRRLDLPTGAAFGVSAHIKKASPLTTPKDIGSIVNENSMLKLDETVTAPIAPVVTNSSNSSQAQDEPIPTPATQRDSVPILERAFSQSKSGV